LGIKDAVEGKMVVTTIPDLVKQKVRKVVVVAVVDVVVVVLVVVLIVPVVV